MARWLITLASATVVAAITPTSATAAPAEPTGRYCVANAVTGKSACSSRANAEAARTTVGVVAASAASVEGSLAADVLVGRLYTALNYGDDIYDIYYSSACNTSATVDWQLASLPAWINDETSSFRGYANCKLQIWADANFGGSTLGPIASSSYVGSTMNDKTSSVKGS